MGGGGVVGEAELQLEGAARKGHPAAPIVNGRLEIALTPTVATYKGNAVQWLSVGTSTCSGLSTRTTASQCTATCSIQNVRHQQRSSISPVLAMPLVLVVRGPRGSLAAAAQACMARRHFSPQHRQPISIWCWPRTIAKEIEHQCPEYRVSPSYHHTRSTQEEACELRAAFSARGGLQGGTVLR